MPKKYLLLYFHVHQPYRLNNYYSPYEVDEDFNYFGGPPHKDNETVLRRIATRCYKPTGEMFLELIKEHGLKISYSFTGTALDQWRDLEPDLLDLYRALHDTGNMELVGETYYHSLAAFYDREEFKRQVLKHNQNFVDIFGEKPRVFRNTELTYRNDVGDMVRELGFKGMFTEGWDPILDWRSPNFMYRSHTTGENHPELKLFLKNYRRSDDVAFRFQLQGWESYPVTADKFAEWVANEPGYLTTLAMDYETVGEHHRTESGIFEFYRYLPTALAKHDIEFILPSEAVDMFPSEEALDYPKIVSWADAERDLSAWTGNEMQKKSLEAVYHFGEELREKLAQIDADEQLRERLLDIWGKLQTSDHYYYMSTKYWSDGDVHKSFSPYETPYDAYRNFINVLSDFRHQIQKLGK